MKLVDVYGRDGNRIGSYPITLTDRNYIPFEHEYERAAIQCAKQDGLVPMSDFGFLTANIRLKTA